MILNVLTGRRRVNAAGSTGPASARDADLFLAGHGIFAIAEGLTAESIACPSARDPARDPHRCGLAWSKNAVRAILTNPRYTGRQVWNRQRNDEVLMDVADVALGHTTKMRWNEARQWIYSEDIAHPPVIDDDTFRRAQDLLSARGGPQPPHRPHRSRHDYALRGLLLCGVCGRKMQGHWADNALRVPATAAAGAGTRKRRGCAALTDACQGGGQLPTGAAGRCCGHGRLAGGYRRVQARCAGWRTVAAAGL